MQEMKIRASWSNDFVEMYADLVCGCAKKMRGGGCYSPSSFKDIHSVWFT